MPASQHDLIDPSKLAVLDAVRCVLWWVLVVAATLLGLHYKRKGSRSSGWKLYLGIFGCIICQAAYMTMWAGHNAAVRTQGYGPLTDTLYRVCIPLYQLAMASFMGLLLLLAAGYSVTRNNLGAYKPQVIGLPILLFVTGVITDYINFHVFESTTDQIRLLEMASWEQGLWFVCTFLNLAAFGFWVVYMFEIIQMEVDAIKAQQELNLVRNAAPSATVAPFPGSFSAATGSTAAAASSSSNGPGSSRPQQQQQPDQAHAAPPPGMDPHWTQAAAEEGLVAYKNLLGPGQNMSHVPGADVEAQEINTVADMVNFEVKRRMYSRFSTGFGVFMIAQLCVILSPVFVIDIVQEVITFLQFLVVAGFLAALLWLFRPAEDSPYLLMGDGLDTLDTALGIDDEDDAQDTPQRLMADGGGSSSSNAAGSGAAPRAAFGVGGRAAVVEMGAAAGFYDSKRAEGVNGSDRGSNRDQQQQLGFAGGSRRGSSVGGAALSPLNPPATLPAIKTSAGGSSSGAGPAAAAANGSSQLPPPQQPAGGNAAAAAVFSLGDDDEQMHEVVLDSAKAAAAAAKAAADKRD